MNNLKPKIAAISITLNDSYKLFEWKQYYEEYKEELYLHIIVDNNSDESYKKTLKETFLDSVFIERSTNGGCTCAYNDGIRLALKDANVEYIALIGNDIRLSEGALLKCTELLKADERLGMVSPVLLKADSCIVADFGCDINNKLQMIPFGVNKPVEMLKETVHYCKAVTGGMNVSKRSFYEMVGLQDELLFMYSDEVDMGLRANKSGIKMAVSSVAKSWHQHKNPPGRNSRFPFSRYLIARNKVYLARKHFGNSRKFYIFCYFFFLSIKIMVLSFFQKNYFFIDGKWMLFGACMGLMGDMRSNKYSKL